MVTEDGTVLGPYSVPDANQMYMFPAEAAGQILRFEVLDSSGGNVGLVDLAVYPAD